MPAPKFDEREFAELYRTLGPREMQRRTGLPLQSISQRRQRIERRTGVEITAPRPQSGDGSVKVPVPQGSARIELDIREGTVLVASDAHYWPGEETLMHRALTQFAKELKPRALILNGDVMDFPAISRHARIGWEHRPQVVEEIEWAQEKTHELAMAVGKARKIWTLGNHCARFESRLANIAPEYAKLHGFHLKDHFPLFEPAWSVFINNEVLVKHRFRGGIHAVHNNLLWSGCHCVTGHLHSAQVRALTLYNERTIWGMDSGCLAEPSARAFTDYTEDNPKNWRSGFGVLTFKAGRLLQPELVLKWDEKHVQFRGDLVAC